VVAIINFVLMSLLQFFRERGQKLGLMLIFSLCPVNLTRSGYFYARQQNASRVLAMA